VTSKNAQNTYSQWKLATWLTEIEVDQFVKYVKCASFGIASLKTDVSAQL